ncbi:MAG: HlyD family efflux transporter periplasmic adaptor subunit [Lachnospiraceae bacterium]|nr:HlyD family efflux transporter periplasmic adaptor subunit [Lachnospiraceae bacterium]
MENQNKVQKSSSESVEVRKGTERNGDAQVKAASPKKSTAYGSGGRSGNSSKQMKKKKGLSRRSVTCIVLIVIFTLVAVLDVANHLTTASASVPSVGGVSFDGSDFDFSDFDSSDMDASDFQGMMPGGSGSGSSDSDGTGAEGFGNADSDFDPSDMESADFGSDGMPSGGGSFPGGSDSGMSFPGGSESADSSGTEGADDTDSEDSTETVGSTQRVVANVRSALNTAWIPILVVCLLGDAAAVTVLVTGIQKEKRAELERINALRAKRGLPPLEAGGKNEEKKDADGITSSQRKRRRSRRAWRVALALLLIVVLVVAAFPSLYNSSAQTATLVMVEETLDGTVQTGTIDTTLSGSGTLTAQDKVEQTVPSAVTVEEYYVENGDTVEEGDLIATVNLTSVQLAIRELQEELDALDADLAEEAENTCETSLTATASGRVKVIYAEEDVSVIDTMNEYGALMLISVDGLMQAQVTALDETAIGDSVTVTLSDGTEVTGRVANVEDGVATVTLSDEEAAFGDEVTVSDEDGNDLGSDTLTIHSELKVTNYYGTVESLSISVDDEVAAGDELLVLTDVGTTAEYQSLLEQREDLEEQMTVLTALMQDNHIYAESTGIVSGISDDATIVTGSVEDDSEEDDAGDTGSEEDDAGSDTDSDENDAEEDDADSDTDSDSGSDEDGENSASIQGDSGVKTAFAGSDGAEETSEDTSVGACALSTVSGTLLVSTASGTLRSTSAGNSAYAYTLSAGLATDADASETDASETDADEDGDTTSGDADADSSSDGSGDTTGSSGSSSGSLISGEFKTVTSGLGSLDSLVSTATDADSGSASESGGTGNLSGYSDSSESAAFADGASESGENGSLASLSGSESTSEFGDTDALTSLEGTDSAENSGGTDTAEADSESLQGESAGAEEETTAAYSVSTTAVFSITPTATMTISISIDELDILSVEIGQTAEITLDALTGQSFTGTVTSIDTSGTNSGGSTKYTAEITLNRTSQMLSGMNATARITLEETEDILVIPVAAISEEGNRSYVYTTYDEETDTLGGLTEVETGVSDGTNVEITSGLSEGDAYYYVYTENITYSVESGGNFLTNLFGGLFGN